MKNYEIVSHKADLAIKGYWNNIPNSFLEKQNQKTKAYDINIKMEDAE